MNKIQNYIKYIIPLITGIIIGYFLGPLPFPPDRLKSVLIYSLVGSIVIVSYYIMYNKINEIDNLKFKEELKELKKKKEEVKNKIEQKNEEKKLIKEKINKLDREQEKTKTEYISSKRSIKKRTGEEASTFLKNL